MNVTATLQNLRGQVPGCYGAALADLATNMVLTTDSDGSVGQEVWDDLAEAAITYLTGPNSHIVAQALFADGEDKVRHVILQGSGGMQIAVRSRTDPPLGFLFLCEADTGPQPLIAAAEVEIEVIADND